MKTNRRSFIKQITGFVAGVIAAFVPKAKAKRPPTKAEFQEALAEVVKSKLIPFQYSMKHQRFDAGEISPELEQVEARKHLSMRLVTDKDREDYCRAHIGCQCAFKGEIYEECMIDSWKETPVKEGKFSTKDCGDWNPQDGWTNCVIGAEYTNGSKELVVYIDGKKAKKDKDGRYSYNHSD